MPADATRQLSRVLRARPGDQIVVLDDSGWEYLVTLDSVGHQRAKGTVDERTQGGGEPVVRLTLYQSVLKAEKFEMVLQKGTELGVSAFVPFYCDRSVPKSGAKQGGEAKLERWRKIITEAAEQSGRSRLPALAEPADFRDACKRVEGLALVPWEEEEQTGLKQALARSKAGGQSLDAVSILIGPEGGFTSEEVDLAREMGILPVTLGKRILRAETAGIAAVTAIMYELGELGS